MAGRVKERTASSGKESFLSFYALYQASVQFFLHMISSKKKKCMMWIISCCCLVAFSFAVNVFTVQRRCLLASTSNHYHLLPNLQVWLAFLYFLANQGKPTPVHNWFLWRFRTRWTHSAASDVFSPLWQVGIENKLWNSPGWFLPPEGFVGCYKDARYTFNP